VDAPNPSNIRGVVDVVRRSGSALYPLPMIPGEFEDWRRRVRRAARADDLRVSIRRTAGFVVVENLDYEVPADHLGAVADVTGAWTEGRELSFDDALHARRRQRLRLVRDPASDAES
jgi:hypothetical protein